MSVFHYLVKNDEGSRSEGDIRAESMDLAIQKLTSNGQIVITLKEVDTTFDFLGPFLDEINLTFERLKNRVPLANIVFFTRQLATMFSAGLTLERAISALSVEEKHKKVKKILTEVGSSIRKGLNLSESLSRHPGVFNNLFVAMTKAGEVSGNLSEILDEVEQPKVAHFQVEGLEDLSGDIEISEVVEAVEETSIMILLASADLANLTIL